MLKPHTPLRLATSRFHAAESIERSGLLPVSIAIGMPKWELSYDLVRESEVRAMCAPLGMLQLDLDKDAFRLRYEARLPRAPRIVAALGRLARRHEAAGCVLLCWEDVRRPDVWCHRRMLAAYIEAHFEVEVPEL